MPKPDSSILPAVLLDAENRQLASGEARLLFSQNRGVFWPHDIRTPEGRDNAIKFATTVQTSDGQIVKALNFRLCPALFPSPHFDFEMMI
jgi:hypothetical protein